MNADEVAAIRQMWHEVFQSMSGPEHGFGHGKPPDMLTVGVLVASIPRLLDENNRLVHAFNNTGREKNRVGQTLRKLYDAAKPAADRLERQETATGSEVETFLDAMAEALEELQR